MTPASYALAVLSFGSPDGEALFGLLLSLLAIVGCATMGGCVFFRLRSDIRSAILGERWVAYPAAPAKGVLLRCLLLTLALRVGYYLLTWLVGALLHDMPLDPLTALPRMLSRWDAPHYLDIARDGYTTVGDAGYNIVFFPLFPWLVRAASVLIGDVFWASLFVNWLCGGTACFFLYRLAEPALGAEAHRAVAWMLLFPTAFYLMVPYSEALFLMLTLGFFLALQRGRYLTAALLGGLAALTRNAGVLLAVPYVLTALIDWCRARRPARGYAPLVPGATGVLLRRAAVMLFIPAGTLVYLLVNRLVYGDPLIFLDIQRDHWQQSLGFFWDTAARITRYAFFSERSQVVFLWVPQLVVMCFSFGAFLAGRHKMTAPQAAYAYAAFFFVLSATWLLSGARYMLALFPVFIILARSLAGSEARKTAGRALGWFMAAAQVFLACGHALGQYVF